MFEILGNVFGRSKKGGSSGITTVSKEEEFTIISETQTLYPSLILTDQMLKGGSNSEVTNASLTPSTSSLPPSEAHLTAMIKSPSSESFGLPTIRSEPRVTCPLDNVPFQMQLGSNANKANAQIDLDEPNNKINDIGSWLQLKQANYSFETEELVISEHSETFAKMACVDRMMKKFCTDN